MVKTSPFRSKPNCSWVSSGSAADPHSPSRSDAKLDGRAYVRLREMTILDDPVDIAIREVVE